MKHIHTHITSLMLTGDCSKDLPISKGFAVRQFGMLQE